MKDKQRNARRQRVRAEELFYALPENICRDHAETCFRAPIDGLFIVGIALAAIIGGVIGLVWLLLAARRQAARACMHRYLARKAGTLSENVGEWSPDVFPVNDDIAPATLEEYWVKSFRSPMDTLRFGSLLLDVECMEKARLVFVDGRLKGRSGGMKAWLRTNAPYVPYHTSMRYKRLAKLYRTALGLAPELPVEWFLPDCEIDAGQINRRLRQHASKLRANPSRRRCEAIGKFTDESLAALRERGKAFFTRWHDSDTVGVEGVTRRLHAALRIYRRPVGPLKRRNAVRTRLAPVFVPSEFRDRAYRDNLRGRIDFSVRCTLRRDERHHMFRDHLTNKLHRELAADMPDRAFAAHFTHVRAMSPLAVDPICNPDDCSHPIRQQWLAAT